MEDMKAVLDEANKSFEKLGKEHPGFMEPFAKLMGAVEKKGALDTKTKELISVSLSISARCKWCIAFHVKKALDAGASEDEIMESCFVAAFMGGGPSLMYAQYAIKALEELK